MSISIREDPRNTAATSDRIRFPARHVGLDGLRALAVIVVIGYHFAPGLLPGGFIGVDVFFVVSGFLITCLLVRERSTTNAIRLGGFWRRRARRLLPALALVLLACSTLATLIGGDVLYGIGWQLLGSTTFSYNWLSIAQSASYFSATTPELFRNVWSLAVEEQFYLIWPFIIMLLLLIPRPRLRVALVTAGALASAATMFVLFTPGTDPSRVYLGTDTHSFGLMAGAALALWRAHRGLPASPRHPVARRTLLGTGAVGALIALGLVVGMVDASDDWLYRGGLFAITLITTFLIAVVTSDSAIGRVSDSRVLSYVGARSYGLYLWHWPLFVLLTAVIAPSGWSAVAITLIGLTATFVLAGLSHRFVEQPIRTTGFRQYTATIWRWLVRGAATRRIAVVASTVLVAVLTVGTISAVAASPQSTSAEDYIRAGERSLASATRSATPTPAPAPAPVRALPFAASPPASLVPPADPATIGQRISMLGDSVMLASAPGLQDTMPGIAIDAVVSRQMNTGPGLVQAMKNAGTLREFVVVGLGTNGPFNQRILDDITEIAGPHRHVVFVNVAGPMHWSDGVDTMLTAFASGHEQVGLVDWASAIAPHRELLARDGIHPGRAGGEIYASAVRDAVMDQARAPVR